MSFLEPHADGTIISVRVHAGARRNEVGLKDGMFKVCVTQAPEKGKANRAVAELLTRKLDLRKSQIELVSGETSREKRFLLRGIDARALAQRIGELALPS
jgi:uncharacterized protein (TIGR00251 family)